MAFVGCERGRGARNVGGLVLPGKPIIALSSCWNSFRHTDGEAMLREIADLGFEYAELSHGVRMVLVPGVLKAVEEGVIKIATVHNFCPLPAGYTQSAPNLYEPSSQDRRELDQWLRHTRKTIDFAAQVGAKVMVTHLGSARFFWFPPSRALKQFVKSKPDEAKPGGEAYGPLLRKACEKLRARMPAFWFQTIASLDSVREYALECGVAIGCENREKFEELPVDDDFGHLFERLAQPHACGYWHDTGHAEIKRGMGLLDHRQHLERNADKLLGFHLHDVNAKGKDHQAIGSGKIDFEMISSFWKPEHVLTLELSPKLSPDDILSSKARVEALVAKRFPG